MAKDQLKIPTFKSLEEFSIWWKTPEVVQFCRNNPEKVSRLQEHHLVKPWFEQLNVEATQIVNSSQNNSARDESPPEHSQTATSGKTKTFGKYILEKKLGQGGMGAVYLASDPTLQRQVALKVMTVPAGGGSASGTGKQEEDCIREGQELIERFNREAHAMAKLKHPNIIQIYEVGTIGKYHYFTMEYIKGPSLDTLIKDKTNKLSHKQIAGIIRDTASALDYAHKQGIIHRDIKPANIIIDSNNRPYLMDFGLAKELTGLDRSLTMSGSIMGTPDYMSPEQAMGEKDKIDHHSDIFSLGATFYHCITGKLPFEGKELYQVLNHVVNKDPTPPSRLINGLSKDLETICLKCMNKEKESRYQTSEALAEDIDRYLKGEPISARPTGIFTKIIKKSKKNKLASISVIGATVIMTAMIIGLSISSINKKQKIEEFNKQAYAEFKDGRYEETIALCNKLLVLAPEDEKIKTLLRNSQSVVKEKEDKMRAEKEAEKAKAEKMQNEKDKRNKAKAVLDRANGAPTPEQKIKIARESLEADPTFGDAYQVIGYAYKAKATEGEQSPDAYQKLIGKAVEYFSKAIEVTPTLAYSYYERGRITAYIYNKPEGAIPDFEKVLQYDPNSYIGYFAKGTIESDQEKYDEAIKSFNKALELYPEYDQAYAGRGGTYYMITYRGGYKEKEFGKAKLDKVLDKAIADLNEALRLNPKNAYAYSNRAQAYFMYKKDEMTQAIADYTEALRLNPDPSFNNLYFNRARAYSSIGNFSKAMADAEMYLKLFQLTNSDHPLALEMKNLIEQCKKELQKQNK